MREYDCNFTINFSIPIRLSIAPFYFVFSLNFFLSVLLSLLKLHIVRYPNIYDIKFRCANSWHKINEIHRCWSSSCEKPCKLDWNNLKMNTWSSYYITYNFNFLRIWWTPSLSWTQRQLACFLSVKLYPTSTSFEKENPAASSNATLYCHHFTPITSSVFRIPPYNNFRRGQLL